MHGTGGTLLQHLKEHRLHVDVKREVGLAYSAFKDDIAKLWQDFHVKLVEHPTPKKTVWLVS